MPGDTIRTGDTGAEVRRLQQVLSDAGFDPGPVDGVFGRSTAAAVSAFQRGVGLPASGVVDVTTAASFRPTRPSDAPPLLRRNPVNPYQRHLLSDYRPATREAVS